MGRLGFLTLLCVGLALVVCPGLDAQVADTQRSQPEIQPSVELPAELARVLRDYERHWGAGDAEALAALFVNDGLIVRGGSWIRGRAAIQAAYRESGGPLQLRAIEYGEGDALGYIVGAYGYGETLPVDDSGMFVLTLRRGADGRWLIVSDLDRGASE